MSFACHIYNKYIVSASIEFHSFRLPLEGKCPANIVLVDWKCSLNYLKFTELNQFKHV